MSDLAKGMQVAVNYERLTFPKLIEDFIIDSEIQMNRKTKGLQIGFSFQIRTQKDCCISNV